MIKAIIKGWTDGWEQPFFYSHGYYWKYSPAKNKVYTVVVDIARHARRASSFVFKAKCECPCCGCISGR